jgi:uncharacterized protein GlcG (DUF336 family)
MRVTSNSVVACLAFASLLAGTAAAIAAAAPQPPRPRVPVPEQFVISGAMADRLYDRISINSATAERLAQTCFQIIQRESGATSATIVILNPYGLVVHEHVKDGQRYTSIKITENKARTALLMREPTLNNMRAQEQDPQQILRYDQIGGLAPQAGGVPIVVNDQLIGAMGIGGFGGEERYHTIAMMCLDAIFGPQQRPAQQAAQ